MNSHLPRLIPEDLRTDTAFDLPLIDIPCAVCGEVTMRPAWCALDESTFCEFCGDKFNDATRAFLLQAVDFYKSVPRPPCAYFLDLVSFYTVGDDDVLWSTGIRDDARHWVDVFDTRAVVSLKYIRGLPAAGADPARIDQTRAYYRNTAARAGGAILEVEPIRIHGCNGWRVIQKTPQQPSGMSYSGFLILPFRDFSFEFGVNCREEGITGLRDTAVFGELVGKGEIKFDAETEHATGWMADPYDASVTAPLARNRSEDSMYDASYPDHPLSRLRRVLQKIQETARFSRKIRDSARVGDKSSAGID